MATYQQMADTPLQLIVFRWGDGFAWRIHKPGYHNWRGAWRPAGDPVAFGTTDTGEEAHRAAFAWAGLEVPAALL